MVTRIMRSSIAVPASAASVSVNSDITQADLEAAVPVGGSIRPFALVFSENGGTSDVTVESLTMKNTKNDEGALAILPKGDGVTATLLNQVTNPESGGVDAPRLSVAHGARLTAVCSNAVASARTITVLWKVSNQATGVSADPASAFFNGHPGSGGLSAAAGRLFPGISTQEEFLTEIQNQGPFSNLGRLIKGL